MKMFDLSYSDKIRFLTRISMRNKIYLFPKISIFRHSYIEIITKHGENILRIRTKLRFWPKVLVIITGKYNFWHNFRKIFPACFSLSLVKKDKVTLSVLECTLFGWRYSRKYNLLTCNVNYENQTGSSISLEFANFVIFVLHKIPQLPLLYLNPKKLRIQHIFCGFVSKR